MSRLEDDYGSVTARFYDEAYASHPGVGADVDFYRARAKESGGPVLELGCGTGRVLLEVARDGLACTGLDASEAMLDVLRRKAGRPPPLLVCAPMQDFDLGDARFGFVYSAFRAFQHLHAVADQLRCLACVRRHLKPGGRFAFDVFNPRLDRMWLEEEDEVEDLRFGYEDEEVVRYTSVTRDRASQVQRVSMRYERRRDGQVVANERAHFHMRWFHRFELEHLMARAGFENVVIQGDFDGSPVGRETPSFIVVGEAPGRPGASPGTRPRCG